MPNHLPYQILHNYDLQNEIWLPLPGLDDYFFISNLDRVKSTDSKLLNKAGKLIFYKDRIYKPQIIHYTNGTTNTAALELKLGFYYLGNSYSVRVARTVYQIFVAAIPADKTLYYIGFKDGNNLYTAADNLLLISPSQKAYNMFHSHRCKPIYLFKTAASTIKAAKARYKPVTQFAMRGLPIAQYKSIQEAATITGIAASCIVAALKQRNMVSSGGFLWHYGHITTEIDTCYVNSFMNRKKTYQTP